MRVFFGLIIFFSSMVGAAPIPVTSSSEFIGSDRGLFHSPLGFTIDAHKTTWILEPPQKKNPYVVTMYRAPQTQNGIQAALTVRVDQMKRKMSLKRYVKSWIKDYPRFGFKILSAKPIKVKSQKAFLIDLINQDNQKQLRQVLFRKKEDVVILSCRDHKDNFLKTLKSCNQIIRNFHWM